MTSIEATCQTGLTARYIPPPTPADDCYPWRYQLGDKVTIIYLDPETNRMVPGSAFSLRAYGYSWDAAVAMWSASQKSK